MPFQQIEGGQWKKVENLGTKKLNTYSEDIIKWRNERDQKAREQE